MNPIIIIGTGLAGYSTAREFRKHDKDSPLTLITNDDGASYSKPMLSNALAQHKTPETLPNASAEKMAEQLDATILTHEFVTMINSDDKTFYIDKIFSCETLEYDKLVLACGASPIQIPIEGDTGYPDLPSDNILSVNNLYNYSNFRQQLVDRKHVLIMGGGLIGCEFANDLVLNGFEVTVVDPAPHPLGRLLPGKIARFVKQKLGLAGIKWQFETTVVALNHAGNGLLATLSNGEQLQTDLVLSAVGLRPDIKLANTAHAKTDRGVVVNEYLETSIRGIYALGDAAQVNGLVLPFIMPIMHASRALGKTLAGERTAVAYPAMPVIVKTPSCPLVVSPPAIDAQGEWQETITDNGAKSLFIDNNGQLAGMALAGDAMSEKQKLTKELPPTL